MQLIITPWIKQVIELKGNKLEPVWQYQHDQFQEPKVLACPSYDGI